MAKLKQARVEFDAQQLKSVTVTPEARVDAIFFNGAEKQFIKDAKPLVVGSDMLGVKVEPATFVAGSEGDTGVCYMIGGQLVCW